MHYSLRHKLFDTVAQQTDTDALVVTRTQVKVDAVYTLYTYHKSFGGAEKTRCTLYDEQDTRRFAPAHAFLALLAMLNAVYPLALLALLATCFTSYAQRFTCFTSYAQRCIPQRTQAFKEL